MAISVYARWLFLGSSVLKLAIFRLICAIIGGRFVSGQQVKWRRGFPETLAPPNNARRGRSRA